MWDHGNPDGFLGDPTVLHTVKGGRVRNTFQALLGAAPISPLVSQFEIAGQCAAGSCPTLP